MSTARSPGLQALRGVAALLVFLQHMFWLAGYFAENPVPGVNALMLGGIGVFLFFGLSGLLMAGKLGDAPGRFAVDRLRRIFPGYLLAVLLTGFSLGLFHYPAWPHLPTWLLLPSGEPDAIWIPYWTLIFELQFYALVLVLLRCPIGVKRVFFPLWALLILVFHPVAPYLVAQASYPSALWLPLSFYNLYFIVGVLAALSLRQPPNVALETRLAVLSGLLAALLSILPGTQWTPLFQGSSYACHLVLLLTVLFGVRAASAWRPRALAGRWLMKLGDLSYGIYLMHVTCGFFAVLIAKQYLGLTLGYWSGLAYLLLAAGLGALLFGAVELRLQRLLKSGQAWVVPWLAGIAAGGGR